MIVRFPFTGTRTRRSRTYQFTFSNETSSIIRTYVYRARAHIAYTSAADFKGRNVLAGTFSRCRVWLCGEKTLSDRTGAVLLFTASNRYFWTRRHRTRLNVSYVARCVYQTERRSDRSSDGDRASVCRPVDFISPTASVDRRIATTGRRAS